MADCISIVETTKEQQLDIKNAKKLKELSTKWFENGVIKATTGGRHREFVTFYESVLPHLNFELGRLPNAKELVKLEKEMTSYLNNVEKTPGLLGRLFKLPENVLNKYPVTKRFFDDMVYASNFYRGNLQDVTSDISLINKNLNIATGHRTMFNKWGWGRNKAQIEIQKRINKWQEYKDNKQVAKANEYYDKELADLTSEGSTLSTLQSLWELMSKPELLLTENISATNAKYSPEIVEAASVWHVGVAGRKPLKVRLWEMLGNGLKDNIAMLKRHEANENSPIDFKIKKIEQLYADYFDPKTAPKYDKNYFPRQVLDIAPTFAKLNDDLHSGYANKNPEIVSKYIDRMIEDVSSRLKVPGSAYERGVDTPVRVSKDVIDIIDTYAHNVVRFNYNARVSKVTTKALQDLNNLEGPKFDQHIKILTDYVMDTHDAALGTKFRTSKLAGISRAITSWQFLSKLGLNVRTVARNATQSLQNWVYFGTEAIYHGMKDLQTGDMKHMIAEEMKRHGYEFVNIQEFAMPKELMSNLKIDNSGKVSEVVPNIGAKFNDWMQDIARISGKPMQWVENNINRGLTFKLAFSQKYNELSGNKAIIQKALNKAKTTDVNAEAVLKSIKDQKRKQASAYAANLVKELHFLYDPWAKPKILRSPMGSVLGQFSTYGINFFEYQRKLASKGGNKILQGEWNSPEAWRLYRLGLLYTAVTGIGAITNAKWSNLVQNDTYERLVQLDKYLKGDKEAFYGKDPITATFGGPFISDIMKLGHLVNFQKLDAHKLSSYFEQYKAAAERTKHNPTEEYVRLMNTQLHRLLYTTGPNIINGTGFMTVVGQELGLYNTPELNALKDKMLYPLQKYLPKKSADYFTPKERSGKKTSKSVGHFSEKDIHHIMNVLTQIQSEQF